MVSVFIGFGGARAQGVAEKLEVFLKCETNIGTFLASPRSRTLACALNQLYKQTIRMYCRLFKWANESLTYRFCSEFFRWRVTCSLSLKALLGVITEYVALDVIFMLRFPSKLGHKYEQCHSI